MYLEEEIPVFVCSISKKAISSVEVGGHFYVEAKTSLIYGEGSEGWL